jgi:glycosyltransferase involved in cell wall biosynthesis/GT2 family glycosyltransferase
MAMPDASDESRAGTTGNLPGTTPEGQPRQGPSVSVVVPTFRRPQQLRRALTGLMQQTRPPDEVIVCRRVNDIESRDVIVELGLAVREALVEVVGVVAALRAGARLTTGDVIALIDDDAIPRPDWLERLLRPYSDPAVVGVGGRDLVHRPDGTVEAGAAAVVGVVRPTGRLVGNHHLGTGGPRRVDVLKGCNCSYRREVLGFPIGLRGDGAQVANDLAMSLRARARGHLIYDPDIVVDHHPGVRHDEDGRERRTLRAVLGATYNETYVVCSTRPHLRWRRVLYCLLVGDRTSPGLVRTAVARARHERDVHGRFVPTGRTVLRAATDSRRRPLRFSTVDPTDEPREVSRASRALETATAPRPKRPRVALVAHGIHDGGGMERAWAELIRHLHNDVRFVAITSELAPDLEPLVERWERIGVPMRPFSLKFVTFFVRAALAVRRADADLVHTLGAIVPNRAQVATVQFCHAGYRAATGSLAPAGAPWLRRLNTTVARALALLAERWCYRSARVGTLAAVSEGVRREIEAFYPRIATAVTPNGVDTRRFRPDPAQRAAFRSACRTEPSGCVALFVGGDWDRKGLGIAIEAAAKARAGGAPVVVWVVGAGDEARFAGLARDLGIGDSVVFFGRRDDTERIFQAADVFVLPTAYETFSIVSFEAAACGLPLVIPDISGAGELVADGRAGLMVERDVAAIADALSDVAADIDRRQMLGAEARRRASTFTWEASASSVADLYASLLLVEGS